ncbi:MAG TPA: recombinase RecT [Thermoanaerobaculia bacterium]|nr:recombinase RecT [Thermoanaerobaculia bacterium]
MTTTALAVPAAFEPENLDQALALAEKLAKSNIIPTPLRAKPADVIVVLLTGRELGLSPMQSLRSLHVVEGRPCLSAELLVALCLRRPEICESFVLVESTDAKATYRAKRRGCEPVSLSWTIEQAAKAGLANKNNWKSHPAAMLRARASSSLARAVFPDITTGVYGEDEADEIVVPQVGAVAPPPARPGAAAAAKDVTPAQAKKVAAPKAKPAPEPVEDAQPAEEPSPAHDAQTGEVTEQTAQAPAGDVPWDAEAEVEAKRDALMAKVAEAPTVEALKALVPEIQQLPESMREQVRGVYGVRQQALKSGAVQAPREPGQEG